jgi:two-component system phosphate regulon sensor histidine kinase PhoR
MAKRKLIWHLFPSFLILTVVSLAAVTWYASRSVERFYRNQVNASLEEKARLFARQVSDLARAGELGRVDELTKTEGKETATRITVVLHDGAASGKVIGDSDQDPLRMENHDDRPEIQAAIREGVGRAERYSFSLKENMVYVAVPAKAGGKTVAVVRMALPKTEVEQALWNLFERVLTAGLVIAGLAAVLSWLISRRLARPLREIRRMAESFAGGDLRRRTVVEGSEETAALGEAMNTMAAQLDERIRTITEQRNEIEAVLFGMVEAVLVVDTDERVVRMNRAAGRYFGIDPAAVHGRDIHEVIRNSGLQRLVTKTLSGCGPVEAEVEMEGEEVAYLSAHGAGLCDAKGKNTGAVIVLNDVTRLVKLENMRRDFAANVSHELRTPITSIKGFLETLRDGKVTDRAEADRFLNIALRETDRLNSIIEDLLSLSRIEKEYERGGIPRQVHRLKRILEEAAAACESAAHARNITIELECDETATATVNGKLLEQAVVNLLDNAVKYSEPGKTVRIAASADEKEAVIRVTDEGCGIESEHLPRLFERFYRVDKSRSRKLGGTGLGLAIVKHIVQAHGGGVSVESQPGKGSAFRILLPQQQLGH